MLRNVATIRHLFMDAPCTSLTGLETAYGVLAEDLYRHCRFRKLPKEDAEEIVQDTFVNACTYIRQGNSILNTRLFLFRVANNLIVDWARRRKVRIEKEVSLDELQEHGFDVENGHDEAGHLRRRLSAKRILTASRKLNADDHALLKMRYIDGLMPADISSRIGVSPNVVSVRLHRALKGISSVIQHAGA